MKINFQGIIGIAWGVYKIYREIVRLEKTTKANTVKHKEVKNFARPVLSKIGFKDADIDRLINDLIYYIKIIVGK